MKKFDFRLQRVLDVKGIIQQVRERELANALKSMESDELVLVGYKEKLNKYQKELRGKKVTSIFEMRFYYNYFSWLMNLIRIQIGRVAESKKEVEKRKKKLTEAFKEKRVIENLKQRTREEYIREFSKDQMIQSDEIAVSKYFLPGDLSPKISFH